MPTQDPLVIPGCDTLLPLTDARDLFSPNTEVLATEDTVPPRGDPPEFDVAASNATIAKNCIWGLPRSDGGFTLAVTDISEADAESLTTALVAAGFMGETVNEITELELTSENMVGTAHSHLLVGPRAHLRSANVVSNRLCAIVRTICLPWAQMRLCARGASRAATLIENQVCTVNLDHVRFV